MRIGVLFNCQAEGVATGLRALLPDDDIIHYAVAGMPRTDEARQAAADALHACDYVVSSRFSDEYGPLATSVMRRAAKKFCRMPALRFRGFHPDMIYVQRNGKFVTGPTGDYHSRIGVLGFLAGMSAGETAALYNRMVFRRLGYLDGFAVERALLEEQLREHGFDAQALLAEWLAQGCFMHSLNHPKIHVLLSVARAACAAMGLAPARPDVTADGLFDRLSFMTIHPVFPDIAAVAGVKPEGVFRRGMARDGSFEALSTEEFVAGCFEAYENVPPASLLAATGVAAGMAALALEDTRSGRQ